MSEGSNIKQEIVNLINNLPEDVTLEDIQYHLFIRQKLQKAARQIAAAETIPHDKVLENLRKKWSP